MSMKTREPKIDIFDEQEGYHINLLLCVSPFHLDEIQNYQCCGSSSVGLTSQFIGHMSADQVLEEFLDGTYHLQLKKLLQVSSFAPFTHHCTGLLSLYLSFKSMNGPNVNWKFDSMLHDHTL